MYFYSIKFFWIAIKLKSRLEIPDFNLITSEFNWLSTTYDFTSNKEILKLSKLKNPIKIPEQKLIVVKLKPKNNKNCNTFSISIEFEHKFEEEFFFNQFWEIPRKFPPSKSTSKKLSCEPSKIHITKHIQIKMGNLKLNLFPWMKKHWHCHHTTPQNSEKGTNSNIISVI